MSAHRDARIFKHLHQLYAGKGPTPFTKKRKGPPPAPDRTWARAAIDALIGRKPKGDR